MPPNPTDNHHRDQMRHMATLIEDIDRQQNPELRARTKQIVQTILDFHGAGLERILEHLAATGQPGLTLIDSLAQDDLISNLLLLYNLHPQPFESRVKQALKQITPQLQTHGAGVELLSTDNNLIHLRLTTSNKESSSPAEILKGLLHEALYEKAPELTAIQIDFTTTTTESQKPLALPILS